MNDPTLPDEYPLHPVLERVARGYRLASGIVFIAGLAIAAMFLAFFLGMQASGNPAPLMLMVVILPPLMMFVWLRRHLRTTLLPRLLDANRLLNTATPRHVRATPLGTGDLKGHLVEIADPGKEESPWGLASVTPARRRRLMRKPMDAQLFMDAADPIKPLVLMSGELLMFGSMPSSQSLARSWQQFRAFLLGLLALLAVIVGFMIWNQVKSIQATEAQLALAEASTQWPRAAGEILASELLETRISRGRSSVQGWDVALEYSYVVGGEEHASTRIRFGWRPTTNRAQAQTLVDVYVAGAAVQPAYDPEDPARAVLEPGHADAVREHLADDRVRMYIGLGMGLAGLSVMAIIVAVQYSRRKKALERVFHLADARDPTS